MSVYRTTARKQFLHRHHECDKRQERARSLASRATTLLKEAFVAKQVLLFGSLARGRYYDMRSEVDLVVWGLEGSKYYRAISRLLDSVPTIKVGLVMAEEAPLGLLAVIKQEGKS